MTTPITNQDLDYFDNPTKLFKCIEDQAWDVVLRRMERMPQEAQFWIVRRAFDKSIVWRRLPIHEALIHSAPLGVVEALITAHPAGAKDKDSSQRLAIHYACELHASIDVIKLLLIVHPACLDEKDTLGNTPGKYLENMERLSQSQNVSDKMSSMLNGTTPIRHSQDNMKHTSSKDLKVTTDSKRTEYHTNIAIQVLQEELMKAKRQLAKDGELQKLLHESVTSNKRYEKELQENVNIIAKLKESLDSSNSELVILKNTVSTYTSTIEDKKRYSCTLENDIECLKNNLTDSQKSIEVLKEEKGALEKNSKKMQEDLKFKNQQVVSLEKDLQKMKDDYQYLLERSHTQLKALSEELSMEKVNYSEANQCAYDLEKKLKEAVDTINQAEERFHEERDKNDADYKSLEEELDCAMERMNTLQTTVRNLESELKAKQEEIISLMDSLRSSEAQNNYSSMSRIERETTIDELSKQLERWKDEYSRLESLNASLRKYEYDNMELKTANESLMMENKILTKENFDLKVQNHVAKNDNAALDHTIKKFQQLVNATDKHSRFINDNSMQISERRSQDREQMELKERIANIKLSMDRNVNDPSSNFSQSSHFGDIDGLILRKDQEIFTKRNHDRGTFTEMRNDHDSQNVSRTNARNSIQGMSPGINVSKHFFPEDFMRRISGEYSPSSSLDLSAKKNSYTGLQHTSSSYCTNREPSFSREDPPHKNQSGGDSNNSKPLADDESEEKLRMQRDTSSSRSVPRSTRNIYSKGDASSAESSSIDHRMAKSSVRSRRSDIIPRYSGDSCNSFGESTISSSPSWRSLSVDRSLHRR